jgi:hypothetical protein
VQSQFFVAAGKDGTLSPADHRYIIEKFKQEIVEYGDVTFLLDDRYVSFLGSDAHTELLEAARLELAPRYADLVASYADECDEDDPDSYFNVNTEALEALETLFPDDEEVSSHVQAAQAIIEETVSEVKDRPSDSEQDESWHDDDEHYSGASYRSAPASPTRLSFESPSSVFDDIDS